MATIHIGTATTLATVPIADCSDADVAYIWLNDFQRKMIFTAADVHATDTTNHPYYIRPSDYSTAGVWIEDVGADQPEVWSADQIVTGLLTSTNWGTSAGSQFDLDAGTIKLGGSASPKFSVTAAGILTATEAIITGAISAATIDIGGADATSFHVDINGNIWAGAAAYNIATNPFAVSSAGVLRAISGTMGGWTLGATSLTSTNVGIHSGASAQILLGHATSYASAKIGLKNDGSGKLANGKIYWDSSGNITLDVPANAGTGVGVIYKGGARWLYDFNPIMVGGVQPDGKNTFLGFECGNLTMGSTATQTQHASNNVGIGYKCLYSTTTGFQNVAVGYECLTSLNTGNLNVGVGFDAGHSITDGMANVVMGFGTGYAISSGAWNVAVGGSALVNGTSCNYNTTIGSYTGEGFTTGSGNVAVGFAAGRYQSNGASALQTPEYSIYVGYNVQSGSDPAGGEDAIDNEIVFGYNAIGNGSDTITLGNTSIGELHCQVALTVDSDERIKRDIQPLTSCLDFINALTPVTYKHKNPFDYPDEIKPCNYKDRTVKEKDHKGKEKSKLIKADKRPDDDETVRIGLVAQEVEHLALLHGIDATIVTTSNQGKKGISYESLIMPLIKSVQELTQRITLLEGV